jgi:hypothetical protein
MPGCSLATLSIASAPLVTVGTTGTLSFALPAQPGFSGAVLVHQAVVVAPAANALGILTSNGVELSAALR